MLFILKGHLLNLYATEQLCSGVRVRDITEAAPSVSGGAVSRLGGFVHHLGIEDTGSGSS